MAQVRRGNRELEVGRWSEKVWRAETVAMAEPTSAVGSCMLHAS